MHGMNETLHMINHIYTIIYIALDIDPKNILHLIADVVLYSNKNNKVEKRKCDHAHISVSILHVRRNCSIIKRISYLTFTLNC